MYDCHKNGLMVWKDQCIKPACLVWNPVQDPVEETGPEAENSSEEVGARSP